VAFFVFFFAGPLFSERTPQPPVVRVSGFNIEVNTWAEKTTGRFRRGSDVLWLWNADLVHFIVVLSI